jgi:hypothetical protein
MGRACSSTIGIHSLLEVVFLLVGENVLCSFAIAGKHL